MPGVMRVPSQTEVRKPLNSESRGPGAGGWSGIQLCRLDKDADDGGDGDGDGDGDEHSGDAGGSHDGLSARLPLALKLHE